MAIFTRRDIQVAVDQVAINLTSQQKKDIVVRLNGSVLESLAAEWEVMVLSAFCQCGEVVYEKNNGGSFKQTQPDILFQDKCSDLKFMVDVRAVSDSGRHEENPVSEFDEAIRLYLQQQGHSSAGIHLDILHTEEGEYPKRKVHLTLPPKNEIIQFVATELGEFLCKIAQYPNKPDIFEYNKDGICFSINYNSTMVRTDFTKPAPRSYKAPRRQARI